jgi:hypothetical protein
LHTEVAKDATVSKPGTAQTISSNSDITAIKAKTDLLTFDGSNNIKSVKNATDLGTADFNATEKASITTAAGSASPNVNVSSMNTDAISASAVSAAAVTKIQSGTATAANLSSAQSDITAIKAKTDQVGFTGSNVNAQVKAADTDAIDGPSIKADAVTKIQNGLALSSDVTTIESGLSTIITDVGNVSSDLSTVSSNVNTVVGKLPPTGSISNFALTDLLDSVEVGDILQQLLAMSDGRFKVNYPNAGDITFFKRDNLTVLFTTHITDTERTRS